MRSKCMICFASSILNIIIISIIHHKLVLLWICTNTNCWLTLLMLNMRIKHEVEMMVINVYIGDQHLKRDGIHSNNNRCETFSVWDIRCPIGWSFQFASEKQKFEFHEMTKGNIRTCFGLGHWLIYVNLHLSRTDTEAIVLYIISIFI